MKMSKCNEGLGPRWAWFVIDYSSEYGGFIAFPCETEADADKLAAQKLKSDSSRTLGPFVCKCEDYAV